MAVWLVRAGNECQHEQRFFKDHRIYLTLEEVAKDDFTETPDYAGIRQILMSRFEGRDDVDIASLSDVIFEFVMSMMTKDYVVTPRLSPDTLAIGQISSPYGFDSAGPELFSHLHEIKWLALDIPASSFSPEFQSYFAVSALVCQVKLSNAALQIQKILGPHSNVTLEPNISVSTAPKTNAPPFTDYSEKTTNVNQEPPDQSRFKDSLADHDSRLLDTSPATNRNCVLEGLGLQAIGQLIGEEAQKNGVSGLVKTILRAGGLTLSSNEDSAKSSVFIATSGPFGLDRPTTFVQVLEWDETCDPLILSQFFSELQESQADQGLLVAWAGFDPKVFHDGNAIGSKVRLWGRKEIVSHILAKYPDLEEQFKIRIPLKRIWIPSNLI